jgi:endo-1,4-beta-D-glucanase Y
MAGHDPDAHRLFDGLWRFVRRYPSGIDSRLMSFEVPFDPQQFDSAFDGDADIAYALLLADAQWGSDGDVDYRAEALTLLAAIKESTIGPQSHLPMLGDWVEVNGTPHNQYTPRSSDFILDHFRSFAHATGDPAWLDVISASQSLIDSMQQNYSPLTGLLPDFIVGRSGQAPQPAPKDFLEGPYDGAVWFNAGRNPWRLGVDALHYGDSQSLAQVRKMSRWMQQEAHGNPLAIHSGYELDGTPIAEGDFFTIFFAAPFGVAAMTDVAQQKWLNDIYDTVRDVHEDYYEDSVNLLCLLTMTRNSWSPELPPLTRRRAARP